MSKFAYTKCLAFGDKDQYLLTSDGRIWIFNLRRNSYKCQKCSKYKNPVFAIIKGANFVIIGEHRDFCNEQNFEAAKQLHCPNGDLKSFVNPSSAASTSSRPPSKNIKKTSIKKKKQKKAKKGAKSQLNSQTTFHHQQQKQQQQQPGQSEAQTIRQMRPIEQLIYYGTKALPQGKTSETSPFALTSMPASISGSSTIAATDGIPSSIQSSSKKVDDDDDVQILEDDDIIFVEKVSPPQHTQNTSFPAHSYQSGITVSQPLPAPTAGSHDQRLPEQVVAEPNGSGSTNAGLKLKLKFINGTKSMKCKFSL